MPLLSVIIPIFNSEKYLERCLNSILLQNFQNYELILIDDGSTDCSQQIIYKYLTKYPQIKYLYQTNSGVSNARNYALEIASGAYIYFMDSDDYIDDGLFSNVISLIKKYKYPDMVMFGYKMISEKTGRVIIKKPSKAIKLSKKQFINNFKLIENDADINSLWNKLYSIKLINDHHLRFSNKQVGEDAIFNYQYFRLMNNVCLLNHVYYNYTFERSGSAMNMNNPKRIWQKLSVINSYEKMCKYFHIDCKVEVVSKKINTIYYEIRGITNRTNESRRMRINEYKQLIKKVRSANILENKDLLKIRNIKIFLKLFLIKTHWTYFRILIRR